MKFTEIPQRMTNGPYVVNKGLEYLDLTLTRWEQDEYYALQLTPDFQRGVVWTPEQQSSYLEYFFSGGVSGLVIHLNKPSWGAAGTSANMEYDDFVCIDGLQRLTALRGFMRNEIRAFGQLYHEFGQDINAAANAESLVFNINNLKTREEVLKWYLQMNSGGTPHSAIELARVQLLLEAEQQKKLLV
jgi:uncharacterized protein with ParB-like and HNH nuclease domain